MAQIAVMGCSARARFGLSEDLGPHAVFFSWVRWDGGDGISRMVVVVVQGQEAPPLILGFGRVFDINSSRWGRILDFKG